MNLSPAQLAAHLDSTNLRLDARAADITALCQEAALHRFACVMIYPTSVSHAAKVLAGTGIKIGTVIGFPSGRFSTAAKAAEIEAAHEAGAHEVDIVMDHAALRDGELGVVDTELRALSQRAHNHGQLVKVIVETCYLDTDQRITALRLCEDAGVEFIKTSTGFGAAGAKAEHIAAWAAARRGTIQLKASGGIKTLADARALIEAGATRVGTSSAAAILAEFTGSPTDSASPSPGY
jgi:deoxyribose-phosphate aldolase